MPCGTSVRVESSVEPPVDVEGLNARHVMDFLKRKPRMLQYYVLQNVSTETILRVIRKKKTNYINPGYNTYTPRSQNDKDGNPVYTASITGSEKDAELHEVIYDTSCMLAKAIKTDVFNMYVLRDEGLGVYEIGGHVQLVKHVPAVPAFAALHKTAVCVSAPRLKHDPRFNKLADSGKGVNLCHTMVVPILSVSNAIFAIVEYNRPKEWETFTRLDFDFVSGVLTWMSAYVQEHSIGKGLEIKLKVNLLLKEKLPTLFEDITKTKKLVKRTEAVTKELIPCEQSTLHWTGQNVKNDSSLSPVKHIAEENEDVVEYVSRTGKVINSTTETSDMTCTPEVVSMLCVPIVGKTGTQGVMQLINRKDEVRFTKEDEDSFNMLAAYIDLAIQFYKKYNRRCGLLSKMKTVYDALKNYDNMLIQERRKPIEIPFIPDRDVQTHAGVSNVGCHGNENFLTEANNDIKCEAFDTTPPPDTTKVDDAENNDV